MYNHFVLQLKPIRRPPLQLLREIISTRALSLSRVRIIQKYVELNSCMPFGKTQSTDELLSNFSRNRFLACVT